MSSPDTPNSLPESNLHTETADLGLLKIGDFAKLAGTNLRTLRYYEELCLLSPASRSQGGFRYYRATDVNRLQMIQTLQDLGLSLERIRELLETREDGLSLPDLVGRVRGALREQDRLLTERIQIINVQRERLREALAKLDDCSSCELHPSERNNYCEPCGQDGQPLPADLSALF
ncbi:MAG: DNA-binding transcriptional MerR regulator [Planctomycetota bacterium]|jgi:DNA-binding transcriptional MerR regulator